MEENLKNVSESMTQKTMNLILSKNYSKIQILSI